MLQRTAGLCPLVLLVLLLASPAAAQQQLHYVSYVGGFRVLDLQVSLELDEAGYEVATELRTVGLIGAFFGGDSHSFVRGAWQAGTAAPEDYDSRGRWNGQNRVTTIEYVQGQPVMRTLMPPNEGEREPVPPPLQAGTIDSLSAMVALVHDAATSGRCDGAVRIFDGRRLSEVSAHTTGMQTLPPTERSSFHGPALRCDFDGRLIAGFRYDDNRARAARPQHGVAWLAAIVPGGPLLPVRIQFETPFFGASTMYLAPETP
jgi:hypothetical protein